MLFTTDQQTLEDLNIFGKHGADSVYALFNRTFTRGGAQVLEEWFRYPLSDEKAINHRSGIIQYFAAVKTDFPFPNELFDQAEQYLADTDERTKLAGGDQNLRDKMANLIGEDITYKTIYKGVTALLEIMQRLDRFLAGQGGGPGVADDAAGVVIGPSDAAIDATGAATPYLADKEVIAGLLADEALRMLLQEKHKGKLPYAKVAAYDVLLRFRHREVVRKILQSIYRLDVYISVAKIAADRGFVFAEALPKDRHFIRLVGVFHPQVKNAVSNTLDITPDSNLIFLTGANMAGKSTFMKSLGIALFLAHMGMPVPATKMTFSVRDGIYTTINLPDNLGMGASHFYAEVLRVKKIAKELSQAKSLFVIFDELFRGTNVKDAYEATVALTAAFAGRRDSMFVISTHIIEAGDVLRERHDNINFVYLPTRMEGNTPVYTYTLEKGITADRHGMVIVRNEGIPDILGGGRSSAGGKGDFVARAGGGEGSTAGTGGGPAGKDSFTADRQTLDDLNLLGKYKTGSVYSLFNRVLTKGGEQLLETMFREPLSDPAAINRRSAVFRYLQERDLRFAFDRKEFSLVEDYIGAGGGNRLMRMAGVFRRKTLEVLLKDETYSLIQEGVRATLSFLHTCRDFASQFDELKEDNPLREEVGILKEILDDPRLAGLPSKKKLGTASVAKFDNLFRGTFQLEMGRLFEMLYYFDLYISVSRVAGEKGFSYAQALPKENNVIRAVRLRHPCLEKAVGNTLSLDRGSNVLFLTGANMAGKSTLMKSFGIAVYLAHMGFPVAADEMLFSIRDGMYTSINVPDNLSLGYSHFYAEVLRVKQAAEAVSQGKSLLVIFDELFKGTNVKDAYDATLAVTEAFSHYRNCGFIISTHIVEVGETLRERCDNWQFAYLPTVMKGTVPGYTYRLEEGITTDRHGMIIIENERILEIIQLN